MSLSTTREDRNYISIGSWIVMFIVMAIPFVNLIMMFVWAFSGDNESKKNYFKAGLIIAAIALVIVGAMFALGLGGAMLQSARQQQ